MVRILAFLISAMLASPAASGAWMREKGTQFSSHSFSITPSYDASQTTFLEYGARDDLVLGAEISFTAPPHSDTSGSARVFLRRPLLGTDRPSVWAYELGFGISWAGDVTNPNLRTGLSWGRGYKLGQRNGWMAVDASIMFDLYQADQTVKIDSTIGLNFNDRFSGMFQVFHTVTPSTQLTLVAPSIVFRPLKNKPAIRVQICGETQIGNLRNAAFKISLWRDH